MIKNVTASNTANQTKGNNMNTAILIHTMQELNQLKETVEQHTPATIDIDSFNEDDFWESLICFDLEGGEGNWGTEEHFLAHDYTVITLPELIKEIANA